MDSQRAEAGGAAGPGRGSGDPEDARAVQPHGSCLRPAPRLPWGARPLADPRPPACSPPSPGELTAGGGLCWGPKRRRYIPRRCRRPAAERPGSSAPSPGRKGRATAGRHLRESVTSSQTRGSPALAKSNHKPAPWSRPEDGPAPPPDRPLQPGDLFVVVQPLNRVLTLRPHGLQHPQTPLSGSLSAVSTTGPPPRPRLPLVGPAPPGSPAPPPKTAPIAGPLPSAPPPARGPRPLALLQSYTFPRKASREPHPQVG